MNIHYQEVKLDTVLSHFAQGFEPKANQTISSTDWFVDHRKGVVVFKLYTQDIDPAEQRQIEAKG
jgi:hypothetical protein